MKRTSAPRARTLVAAVLGAALLLCRVAFAVPEEDRDKARKLADQAKAALARKDYAAAIELFDRAKTIISAPTLDLGRARAEVGLGHLLSARQIYASIAAKPPDPGAPAVFARAVNEAAAELADLELRLPQVRITVQGPSAEEATVLLDGAKLPKPERSGLRVLEPGPHVASASAPDYRPVETPFTAKEGVVSQIQLDLEIKLFAAKRQRVMLASALLGVGAASLAFGGATGAMYLLDTADQKPLFVALPGLGVGVAGLGVGTALYMLSNREGGVLPIKVGPGLFGAGVAGLLFGAASGIVSLTDEGSSKLGTTAIISLAAGGVAAASGTLLILLAKEDPGPTTTAGLSPARRAASRAGEIAIMPYVGPGFAGVLGSF